MRPRVAPGWRFGALLGLALSAFASVRCGSVARADAFSSLRARVAAHWSAHASGCPR